MSHRNLQSLRNDEQAAPSRADYNAATLAGAEAEFRATILELSHEYEAARAAGDTERAAAIKARGAALINFRYGL